MNQQLLPEDVPTSSECDKPPVLFTPIQPTVDDSPPLPDGSDGRQDGENYHILPANPSLASPDFSTASNPPSPIPQLKEEPIPPDVAKWLSTKDILTDDHVQQLIRKISKNDSLNHAQKNRLYQKIHSHRFHQRREREAEQLKKNLEKERSVRSYSNVLDPDTGEYMMGCEHYPRYCKLKAACCGIWVVCRQCHDRDEMGHTMPRHETEEVMCMRCGEVQPVSKTCIKCHKDFAAYFCSICKFYDNTPGKSIYHCNDCKICRVGKGIGIDNFHCLRCDACVSKDYAKNHRCLKKSLDANCPICGQYLYTSTKPVVFMRCGHTMHSHCFDVYTAENFTCPLCHKALTNMTPYYRQIDEELERHEMPEEHRDMMSEILCHDCDRRSVTNYHYVYHKCGHCGSYNTRQINMFRKGESSHAGEASGSGAGAMQIVEKESDSAEDDGNANMESESVAQEGPPAGGEGEPVGDDEPVRGEDSDFMVET